MPEPGTYQKTALDHLYRSFKVNHACLEQMNNQAFTSGIAWATRNLLELSVWTHYCCYSEANAKRFCEDGARDAMGSMELPDEMIRADKLESFKAVKAGMLASAVDDEIEDPTSYTHVADAAKAIKFPNFGKLNMLLSKWTHPTAMSITGAQFGFKINPTFYTLGNRWALAGLKVIESFPSL